MESNMKWSVVICCFNSARRILPTLAAIESQLGVNLKEVEIVVVNNRSTDDTVEVVNNWGMSAHVKSRVVNENEPGHSFARRAGVVSAEGEYICFLDDDNVPDSEYLMRAGKVFEDDRIVFCGGASRYPAEYTAIPLLGRYFSKSVAVGRQRRFVRGFVAPGEFLWGAGLCVRTEDMQALYEGGFDPVLVGHVGRSFVSGDDGEITMLLQLSGKRGYYDDGLTLVHRVELHRLRLWYFLRLFYGMGLAKPVLNVYSSHIARVAPVAQAESPPPLRYHNDRLHGYSVAERAIIAMLYLVLGFAFYLGRIACQRSNLPSRARAQLGHLSRGRPRTGEIHQIV